MAMDEGDVCFRCEGAQTAFQLYIATLSVLAHDERSPLEI